MRKYFNSILILCVVIVAGIWLANSLFGLSEAKEENTNSSYVDLLDIKMIAGDNLNLMIVAHPDDETIWGGAHLLEEDYFVVCVTCGNVAIRDEEFKTVMGITGDSYTFLGYPDLAGWGISDWVEEKDSIKKDLEQIIGSREWKSVVTHNPDGEYGHKHHKMLSAMVSEVTNKDNLYYFGRYYTNDAIPVMDKVDNYLYNIKMNNLISVYKSQPKAMKRHNHMMEYENFVSYYEW